jgi:histidine triad (HIT) family protein
LLRFAYQKIKKKESWMTTADCLFCKMVTGDIACKVVLKTKTILAFEDIAPQAPVHVLVIHHTHTNSLTEMDSPDLFGELFSGIQAVAKHLNLTDYRTVINTGAQAGQSVFHTHVHLLAGRPFTWPPG